MIRHWYLCTDYCGALAFCQLVHLDSPSRLLVVDYNLQIISFSYLRYHCDRVHWDMYTTFLVQFTSFTS